MILRPAAPTEAGPLSELALRSKGHWGYDEAFLAACAAELTLRPEDLAPQRVTVGEIDGRLVGFYAIAGSAPDAELAALFVEPDLIGRGCGKALWNHAVDTARTEGIERLTIAADPGALPFYQAMGAAVVGSAPSGSVPGRRLPLLVYPIPGRG